MHWSMKSGFDKVIATMNMHTSADVMMDSANRKAVEVRVENAQEALSNKLWTDDPTLQKLTNWCARRTQQQIEI